MSDDKNESRINIADLPQAEQELSAEEAKEVKGGDGAQLQLQGGVTHRPASNTYTGVTTVQSGNL